MIRRRELERHREMSIRQTRSQQPQQQFRSSVASVDKGNAFDGAQAQTAARPWLHGLISRDQAELLITEAGFADGQFLVRESTSVAGAFVLSVCNSGEILHHIVYHGKS